MQATTREILLIETSPGFYEPKPKARRKPARCTKSKQSDILGWIAGGAIFLGVAFIEAMWIFAPVIW